MADTLAWRSLVRRKEFQRVYERGVKKVGRLLVVYLLPADDMARAVVASRKLGGAVKRNRAKRLLREAFRTGCLARPDDVIGLRKRLAPPASGCMSARDAGNGRRGQGTLDTGPPQAGPSDEGLWVVLVARRRILAATAPEVRGELDDLLGDGRIAGVDPGPETRTPDP